MLNNRDLALSALAALPDEKQSILRRFYYDLALSASPSALPSLLAVADPRRITYGTLPIRPDDGDRVPERPIRELFAGPRPARGDRPRQFRGALSPAEIDPGLKRCQAFRPG